MGVLPTEATLEWGFGRSLECIPYKCTTNGILWSSWEIIHALYPQATQNIFRAILNHLSQENTNLFTSQLGFIFSPKQNIMCSQLVWT